MRKLSQKVLASGMSLVLAVGLTPLPAFAATGDLAAGNATLSTQAETESLNVKLLSPNKYVYNGAAYQPNIEVTSTYGKPLTAGTDYTVSYTTTEKVAITYEEYNNDDESSDAWVYGSSYDPLTDSSTYYKTHSVEATSLVDYGSYTGHVTGVGAYAGSSHEFTISIVPANNWDDVSTGLTAQKSEFAFTGAGITPAVYARTSGKVLRLGTDYSVTYQGLNNQNGKWEPVVPTAATTDEYVEGTVGYSEYRAVVTPLGSWAVNNAEARVYHFYIVNSKNLEKANVVWPNNGYIVATGSPLTPKPQIYVDGELLTEGKDYTIAYKSKVATELGPDEYGSYDYDKYDSATNTYKRYRYTYVDTTVVEPGEYYAYILGIGNYASTSTEPNSTNVPFYVYRGQDLSSSTYYYLGDSDTNVYFENGSNFKYTGASIQPKPVVTYRGTTLTENVDYVLTYSSTETVNPGRYGVTVNGINAYRGSTGTTYAIYGDNNLSDAKITFPNNKHAFAYTGKGISVKPEKVELYGKELKEGRDYTVTYQTSGNIEVSEPVEIGNYRMILVGQGAFAGQEVSGSFSIVEKNSLRAAVIDMQDTFTYDGSVVKPIPTITLGGKQLKQGKDYTISYYTNPSSPSYYYDDYEDYYPYYSSSSVYWNAGSYDGQKKIAKPKDAGSYIVRIMPKGSKYIDSVGKTFTIKAVDLRDAEVTLDKDVLGLTGKNLQPKVTVKYENAKGKMVKMPVSNYTVAYPRESKEIGDYAVTIVGKNNLRNTINMSYTVGPKNVKLGKVKAAKKGFTAKWSKLAKNNKGYEIQYSVNKDMSDAKVKTVKKVKTTKLAVKKLQSKTKYYVQVRSWTKVDGTKYVGEWSKAKTVTTK